MNILSIDIGGSHVKVLATGEPEHRRVTSGPEMTPAQMVEAVKRLAHDWKYDAVSMGFPGQVVHGRIATEPQHLASGWVDYDFSAAFEQPVRIVNDAAMQALGSYEGGTMLFLGLGTGLGSALIVEGQVVPMELAHLPYKKGRTYEDYVSDEALERMGHKRWRKHVAKVTLLLKDAFAPDYVVIGGGNATHLLELGEGVRLGDNSNAFKGGFRLWDAAPGRG